MPFLSKVIEKAVALQLTEYLKKNSLQEKYQSAYKQAHGTETALLCVHNDIVESLDKGNSVLLVLLDLSAAFDTIDHAILLKLLKDRIGLDCSVLKWFETYLRGRSQTVCVNTSESLPVDLLCGVPQGLVLRPLIFTIYMLPLGDILRKWLLAFHGYADDTQLYNVLQAKNNLSVKDMENCIEDVSGWM